MTSKTLDLEKRLLGQWNALVRRARIARDYKAAAFTMSSYADPDGTGIRLSVARYAVDLDVSYSTARRYLTWLRKVGLVEMTRAGNRRKGTASEYRLVIGPEVSEALDVLTPAEHKRRADEMREAERDGSRGRAAKAKTSDQRSSKVSVENDPDGVAEDANQRSPERALIPSINAQMAPDQRSPWMTYTPFRTHLSDLDRPSRADGEELRTDVAVDGPPLPPKCPHGLKPQRRADGRPSCALCRREQAAGPDRPDPPPDNRPHCEHGLPVTGADRCELHGPPPTIAPVIDLDSRRTA